MNIQPTETQLAGKSSVHDGQMIADPICDRINKLIESNLKKVYMMRVGGIHCILIPTMIVFGN
jgi:hypothetical protein